MQEYINTPTQGGVVLNITGYYYSKVWVLVFRVKAMPTGFYLRVAGFSLGLGPTINRRPSLAQVRGSSVGQQFITGDVLIVFCGYKVFKFTIPLSSEFDYPFQPMAIVHSILLVNSPGFTARHKINVFTDHRGLE